MISKHLPTLWSIKGLSISEGKVFLTDLCAKQWLNERGIPTTAVSISPAEVVYYPSRSDGSRFKTMEELIAERNEALDREKHG